MSKQTTNPSTVREDAVNVDESKFAITPVILVIMLITSLIFAIYRMPTVGLVNALLEAMIFAACQAVIVSILAGFILACINGYAIPLVIGLSVLLGLAAFTIYLDYRVSDVEAESYATNTAIILANPKVYDGSYIELYGNVDSVEKGTTETSVLLKCDEKIVRAIFSDEDSKIFKMAEKDDDFIVSGTLEWYEDSKEMHIKDAELIASGDWNVEIPSIDQVTPIESTE